MTKDLKPSDLLSSSQLSEIKHKKDWINVFYLALNWLQVFLCMTFFHFFPSVITLIICILIIGSRQFALAVLMHEGAHNLLFSNKKYNDWFTQWFCAFPILNDNRPYRSYHLLHHRYTETDKDPDLSLSAPFPIKRISFIRKIIRDLTGLTGIKRYKETLKSIFLDLDNKTFNFTKSSWDKFRGFFITNCILFIIISFFFNWAVFFLLWWLPSLTYYSFIIRIRNIAEHAATQKGSNLTNTRTTRASYLLRYFMVPLNVNYHLEHHLFTNCPWYNLPKAHNMLKKNGFLDRMCVEDSYYSVLKKAIRE
ncbi:MAG: fatty acid desaturase family protein [SAR86 cluster bacterium]|nr:fatty acid desaturase family protein [SAR86 cluster bacterium]